MDAGLLRAAVAALHRGLVVGHPTETVYGLGADPFNPVALERLAGLKGGRGGKGYIVLIAGREGLAGLVTVPPLAAGLMARFWPGPLTLVLGVAADLPAALTGGGGELAVRWSPHPVVGELLARWGRPLVSTSANRSGHPPLLDGEAVRREWGERVAVVLPGRGEGSGLPSTVVRVTREGRVELLRPGALRVEDLATVAPGVGSHPPVGTPRR